MKFYAACATIFAITLVVAVVHGIITTEELKQNTHAPLVCAPVLTQIELEKALRTEMNKIFMSPERDPKAKQPY
jgi:hypothetical protein